VGAAFAATVLLLLVAFAVTATVQSRAVARQRDRAEGEAAKALAVNRFMSETLSAANPWGEGYDVSVAEALDRATAKIATSFEGQPLVEAEVRHTIGTAYKNLGRYDRAEPLLEAPLDTRTRLLGGDDPETIETLSALAELAWRRSRFDEAVDRTRDLLERQRRVYGEPSAEVAGSLEDLGRFLTDAGRYDEAEPALESALAMSLELDGEQSLQVAACYESQATLVQMPLRALLVWSLWLASARHAPANTCSPRVTRFWTWEISPSTRTRGAFGITILSRHPNAHHRIYEPAS
jgi:eukaryotic-like serine/threonine-protein kinase